MAESTAQDRPAAQTQRNEPAAQNQQNEPPTEVDDQLEAAVEVDLEVCEESNNVFRNNSSFF